MKKVVIIKTGDTFPDIGRQLGDPNQRIRTYPVGNPG